MLDKGNCLKMQLCWASLNLSMCQKCPMTRKQMSERKTVDHSNPPGSTEDRFIPVKSFSSIIFSKLPSNGHSLQCYKYGTLVIGGNLQTMLLNKNLENQTNTTKTTTTKSKSHNFPNSPITRFKRYVWKFPNVAF